MAIELMGTREEEAPLVIDISERETPKNQTRDIHILSCAFLIFLAYGAAQNLETTVNAFNGEFWAMFALHQVTIDLCYDGTILMCFLRKVVDKEEKVSEDSSVRFCSAVMSTLKSVITPLLNLRTDAFDHSSCCLFSITAGFCMRYAWNFRADYTKDVVNPILGEAGVGGAMAVYGAFDAICSLAAGRLTSGLRSITLIQEGHATRGVLGKVYPLLMAALLGIGAGVLNMQLSALHALLSKHDMTMAVIMLAAIFVSLVPFMYLIVKVENAFSKAL
ncbi:hypothetical protein Gogos_002138, partial [Gossypium gossypioides]|nr:hypothetical protein [Gossypium gossypioides]